VFLRSMEVSEDDNNETLSFLDFLEEIAVKKRISTLDEPQEEDNLPISKLRQFAKQPPSDPKTQVPPNQKSHAQRLPTPYTINTLIDPKTHVSPDSKGSVQRFTTDPKCHVPQPQKDRIFQRGQTHRNFVKTDPLLEGVMNQNTRVSKDDLHVPRRLQWAPGQPYSTPPRAYSNSNAVVRVVYDGTRNRDKTREFLPFGREPTFEPASARSEPAITRNMLDRSDAHQSGVNSWPSMNASLKLSRGDIEWMQDNETKVCLNMACQSKFSVTWRRHHCRYCGKIYCGNCCPIEKSQGFRICVLCSKCYTTSGEGGGKPPKN